MHISHKEKQTNTKKMLYLGGAIWEGQDIEGVEKTPQILRDANLFLALKEKYGVQTIDLGDISAKNYQEGEHNEEQATHKLRNLQLLDNLLGQINNRIVEAVK